MIGSRLAHYDITGHLGSGGMGDVYEATDSKLGRSVAIKLLPEAFARDTERVARFDREARVLAQLNHPNIAAIYGLEESGERKFLVMELVPGEMLAERIRRGPVPVDEAMNIAKQICEALEAAHEKGIIHRDLKPANVKITPEGKVKVLDFGLAKAFEPERANADLSNSPTLSMAATNAGVILGTAAYMSPEQAKGRQADRRADIFAFGCVLYEMLSGRRAFDGDSVSDVLASVLAREPDWSALPPRLNSRLLALVKRCLQKNRKERWHAIGDVRIELETPAADGNAMVRPVPSKGWMAIAAVFFLTTIAFALLSAHLYRSPEEAALMTFSVPAPDKSVFETPVSQGTSSTAGSVSPEGRKLTFTAKDSTGKVLLWVRPLGALVAQPLAGTEDAGLPFWSPDSRWVGFFAQAKLKKVDVTGGPPQILCDAPLGRGGTWNRDGTILFAANRTGGLSRVNSAGGEPAVVTKLSTGQDSHRFPLFLPDGRHFTYTAFLTTPPLVTGIYVGELDSSTSQRLLAADSAAIYARPGYLLFVRQGTLLAQPFDATKLQATGDPVRIAESIPFDFGVPAFSVSDNGVLTYRTGPSAQHQQLAWFDRAGKLLETVGEAPGLAGVDLSPDGKRIAVHRHEGAGGDIWVLEPSRGTMTRLTFDAPQDNSMPIWSPDGSRIAFQSLRNGKWGVYRKPSNGTGSEELLVESDLVKFPMAWSPDGKSLVYGVIDPKTGVDLSLLPLTGEGKPAPLLNSSFNEIFGQVSPDGKWMAYSSDETGREEVYVKPFPSGEGKWQVSRSGGTYPRWRCDGREIFYQTAKTRGRVMSVEVKIGGATFEAGSPQDLFDSGYEAPILLGHPGYWHAYAVSPDGQRFLISRPVSNLQGENASAPITVILNWTAALKR